ncbi:unnamed protein product [Cylindrotheca closterium]|uniref:Cyclin-like domain-containing protein n=1 Tax=Cylindrotheca closterium TaxID=2856 RepID=A0AAD2JMN7_9STRA|nr:unnamed protein product [Cylindrotheca closterium]
MTTYSDERIIEAGDDMKCAIDVDQTFLTIQAMLGQEKKCYKIPDYLQGVPLLNEFDQKTVDQEIRLMVAHWTLQLAEACDYGVETSCLAMSCLDRFLSTMEGYMVILNPHEFQKAALTSLYIAVKMNEFEVLGPQNIALLSRGQHTAEDVEEMELFILKSLNWRVNPPTALSFVRLYLQLVPNLNKKYLDMLMEVAESQIKQSILDYDLCRTSTSKIAFASMMNAIAIVYGDKKLCTTMRKLIGAVTDIDFRSLKTLQRELFEAIPIEDLESFNQSDEEEKKEEELGFDQSVEFDQTGSHKPETFSDSPREVYKNNCRPIMVRTVTT